MLAKTVQGVMGREENEQMGIEENWVCFDVEKNSTAERKIRLFGRDRPEERYGEKTDAREDGRQTEKGQTRNDLVPGVERMDQTGHGCCIATGDR